MDGGFNAAAPAEYLANDNPFAFCEGYHDNTICLPERRARLTALQHIQPGKLVFRMPQRHLERERQALIEAALTSHRSALIKRGLQLLGLELHDNAEALFEQHLDDPAILGVVLELRKHRLVQQQRQLRAKVSAALARKLADAIHCTEAERRAYCPDNLRDALVFAQLEELHARGAPPR